MDTIRSSSARRCVCTSLWLAAVLAMVSAGCKADPTNPFLGRHKAEDKDHAADDAKKVVEADESPAEAAAKLGQEIEDAVHGTADQVRQASALVAEQAATNGRQIAAQGAATARAVAADANTKVQTAAIVALEDLPIEQAGPMLLLAIAEGSEISRRAASEQLSRRWKPAADFPVDAAAASRAAAIAALRQQWIAQYGQINDAVVSAKAQAQEIIGDAQQVVSNARQVADAATDTARELTNTVNSLRQANLPQVARQQAEATLDRLAMDASAEVRLQTARAIGEVADEALVPLLMSMLADEAAVQREAMASLAIIAGADMAASKDGATVSDAERAQRWRLWYRDHPNYAAGRR